MRVLAIIFSKTGLFQVILENDNALAAQSIVAALDGHSP
jgi:hypothetical protein